MVPVHFHGTEATARCAGPQLCHGTQKRLAGFRVDLGGVNRIRIEVGKVVGAGIVRKGKCEIPADAPVDLQLGFKLHIVLEIGRYVGVPQVGVTCAASATRGDIAEQKAREPISCICAGCANATRCAPADQCLLVRICSDVGSKTQQSRATRLAGGAAAFEVVLVRFPNVHTDVHIVATLYEEQIAQEGVARFVIDSG